MNDEIIFAEGLFYNQPRENAPDWVLGSISVEPKKFTDWLRANYDKNEKYVKIDIKMGKNGKPYTALNTWKPNQGGQTYNNAPQARYDTSQGNNNRGQSTQRQGKDDFVDDFPF